VSKKCDHKELKKTSALKLETGVGRRGRLKRKKKPEGIENT
jgi:hypothetical protein